MKYSQYMKTKYIYPAILLVAAACGGSEGDKNLEAKKAELDKARTQLQEVKGKITELEKEISLLDPEFARQNTKAILVSTFIAEKKPFEHKVEVRGAVESRRNVYLSAQIGGEIKKINVIEGQKVSQGQTLIELDAEVIRKSIAELKTGLELATTVYEKQSQLWAKKIGTEVQYLQAKNNKESLEGKLSTAYAQLNLAMIKAPFSGTVDQLPARVGEMASPGVPLVRIVSTEQMYLKTDVSERFIGRFSAGDKVDILFPLVNKTLSSVISSVGQVINEENRTFEVEIKLPKVDFVVKPNQVVILQLRDYVNENAFAVPTRLIQQDEDGQFIYIVEKRESGTIARKIHVSAGISSANQTEILEGLKGDERIVDQGFRDLTEGVEVMIADKAVLPAVAKK
ncbi:MAG TPA: efflux RND transporter periplasmic adaptor subunit [Cytophagales bacterium]|nr:efflux RND transporter periplasmic adaptor subunit [Cytophagales bacterium]HCR54767.1 efflux RND transporter periplasmic adaptor subunit [Cytophagales bacterium]